MTVLHKAKNFDAYSDKKLYPMYDKLFEKEYPYIEKIASGYHHSVVDLLNVHPDPAHSEVIDCHDYIFDPFGGLGKRSKNAHALLIEWPRGHDGSHEGFWEAWVQLSVSDMSHTFGFPSWRLHAWWANSIPVSLLF
ncbi:hypothetical protein Tco_0439248 [Tanacetum coccineum]